MLNGEPPVSSVSLCTTPQQLKSGKSKDFVLNPGTGEAFFVIQSQTTERWVLVTQAVIGEIVLISEHGAQTCPNCGYSRVPPDANYCPRCGHPLTHPQESPG